MSPPAAQPLPQQQQQFHQPGGMAMSHNQAQNFYQQQQPQQPRLMAAQLPDIVATQRADAERFLFEGEDLPLMLRTSQLGVEQLPPLPATQGLLLGMDPETSFEEDTGNCQSLFMRPTLWQVPCSEELYTSSRIPLGIVVQPFAEGISVPLIAAAPLPEGEGEGSDPLVRCNRCRAYVNVFCRFGRGGRSWECNICGMENEVPSWYFCHLDASGRRTDRAIRPELCHGSVDWVLPNQAAAASLYHHQLAGSTQKTRAPAQPNLLFLVDCSRAAVQCGAFQAALQAIGEQLQGSASSLHYYGKMALLLFDRSVSLFDLRPSEPQLLVMGDVVDPFLPLHGDGLFCDFRREGVQQKVLTLLGRLPQLFAETRTVDSCLGAALSLALQALSSTGGRIVLFQSSLCSVGPGQLKSRASSSSEEALLQPQTDYYSQLGKQAAQFGVAVSLLSLSPTGHADLASLQPLVTLSSGHLLHYPRFAADRHGPRMCAELAAHLRTPFVFDAVLRLRMSNGLQVEDYHGTGSALLSPDQRNYAVLAADQTLAVSLLYDASKLPTAQDSSAVSVYAQCVILHTDAATGQRRVRIHNLGLPLATTAPPLFRYADLDAYWQLSVKRALAAGSARLAPAAISSALQVRAAQLLAAYRRCCCAGLSSSQLVLPDPFKLLPIYAHALNRSPAFQASTLIEPDSRVAALTALLQKSSTSMARYLYPSLLALHKLPEIFAGKQLDQGTLPFQLLTALPQITTRLGAAFIESQGIYLLGMSSSHSYIY